MVDTLFVDLPLHAGDSRPNDAHVPFDVLPGTNRRTASRYLPFSLASSSSSIPFVLRALLIPPRERPPLSSHRLPEASARRRLPPFLIGCALTQLFLMDRKPPASSLHACRPSPCLWDRAVMTEETPLLHPQDGRDVWRRRTAVTEETPPLHPRSGHGEDDHREARLLGI
jgi:hypothetical protein